MNLWYQHDTIRENEAKRDLATNLCQIDDKTYPFRAPESDDIFDVIMLGRDDEKRLQNWNLPMEMERPDECTLDALCNQLKISPQELGECYPCVVSKTDTEFVWAIQDWFNSEIRTVATESTRSVPMCVNFNVTTDGIVTTADQDEVRENERIQSLFTLNRMKSTLPNHWARRMKRRTIPNRVKSPTAMAKKAARQQIKQSGLELELPAPINRSFSELETAWKRLLEPNHMMMFPPETEYDYAILSRSWLMEIEAIMFGEAVMNTHQLSEDANLLKMAEKRKQNKVYEKIATKVQQDDQKR